ncbi:MAG: polysaccharide biosynthesis/export family protein [Pseudomonadota bacterium]
MPFPHFKLLGLVLILSACASNPKTVPADEPALPVSPDSAELIWPGDRLFIDVPSAPELSREVTLTYGGQIDFPPIGTLDAASRTVPELKAALETELQQELIEPAVNIRRLKAAPHRVFVGGAVSRPGAIELPGQVGTLEAIIMAGGFLADMKQREIMLIRRGSDNEIVTRSYDLRNGLTGEAIASWGPLQRFDIIYVSPNEVTRPDTAWRSRLNNILPIDFAIFFGIS